MIRSLLVALSLFVTSAHASELKLILPAGADDAHTINARIFQKYLTKHIEGNPTIVLQNVPGASSVVAANYLYRVAPKDGSVIGVVFKNIPLVGALGGPGVDFDARDFTWLGSTMDGKKDAVILWSTKRKLDSNLIVGTDGANAADTFKLLQRALGLKMHQVAGYPNPGAVRLALEQGEVDASISNLAGIKSSKPGWLKPESPVKALLQFGNGTQRVPAYPNVPTLAELTKDPEARKMLGVFETQFALLRPYLAPPDIPKEEADKLRKGFLAAANDPEYAAEAAKMGIEVSPIGYEEAERIVKTTYSASKETLDSIRSLSQAK